MLGENKMLKGPKPPMALNPERQAARQAAQTARKEARMARRAARQQARATRQAGGITMGTPGSRNVNSTYNTY
jgi:hypothetical protein